MNRHNKGFSIPEVMVAMFILTVGLISVLALFSTAVDTMSSAQDDLIAKQKAREAMESVYTARESTQLSFNSINNTTTSGGVFMTGFRNLTAAGSDGLLGTTDYGAIDTMILPGPDGMLGTSDDQIRTLSNFQRQISITPVIDTTGNTNPDLRNLSVTIQFTNIRGGQRNYTVTSMISRFR